MAIVNNTSTSPAEQASEIGVEIWRDVQGYEGRYKVSNLGRVKSLVDNFGNQREKMLNPIANRQNYLYVNLCKDGERKAHKIHRLVLCAFKRAKYADQIECRHLNNDPADNRLFNIVFGTKKENGADRVAHGTQFRPQGERHHLAKLTEEQVREIRRLYATGKYYHRDIGGMFGVTSSMIGNIVNRKNWAHIS